MSAINDVLTEIAAELARIEPIHEGLRDYARLNLTAESHAAVAATLALYDAHVARLTVAQLALEALQPLTVDPVTQAVYDDLIANRDTIQAALGQFTIAEAMTMSIEWGTPTKE